MANGKARQQVELPAEVTPVGPGSVAVRTALTRGVERMLQSDPAARQGVAEGVHGMRTSTRRLRSALRTFGTLVKAEWSLPLEQELKWLAEVLGAVRDLDVLRDRLLRASGDAPEALAPLFRTLAVEHERASGRLKAVLQGDRYRALIDLLEQSVIVTPVRRDAEKLRRSELPSLVGEAWKSVKKRGRALRPTDPDKDFHEVRKRAKRARYAAEDVADALGKNRAQEARRFAELATKVQDILGEHQDAIVAAQEISRIVALHPYDIPFTLAAHRLFKRQMRLADRSRERFFKVWNQLDRKKNCRWLNP
ncbi:CHAD domain-containing protein [Singulisphaera sp. GP187]|uniref:CHAD domain-containing protein n=1 Tax=Singulisphaera sp. GP187 TaxID=1882752 RepID=UPI0009418BBD|nr:CHAD domain-containing protein [Singulisphaera sp. GP187]